MAMDEDYTDLATLENARIVAETGLRKWQMMISLESDAKFYRTIPLPIIHRNEVLALAILGDCLLHIAQFCTEHECQSYRGEDAEPLFDESKRLVTVALTLAVKQSDNFGEGRAYASLGKSAYVRNNLPMARRFFSSSLNALSLVVKRDHAWNMLKFEVNQKLKRIEKKLQKRSSMMNSFKAHAHEGGGNDEEGKLLELFMGLSGGATSVNKETLGKVLNSSGSSPLLTASELDDVVYQISGVREDDPEQQITFVELWFWWKKGSDQKVNRFKNRHHVSIF
jgi:hypothetical protein